MGVKTLKDYHEAKRARKYAEDWQGLPSGPKYQNDGFFISTAHCKAPQLTRCGQQSHGGKNYWETGPRFNNAILEHIVENWHDIYPSVLARLKDKEAEALKNCQSFIDKMQKAIDEA